jgi:hypothetical protein
LPPAGEWWNDSTMDSRQRRSIDREMRRRGGAHPAKPASQPEPTSGTPFYETPKFAIAFAIFSVAVAIVLTILGVRMKHLSWLFIPAWLLTCICAWLFLHRVTHTTTRLLGYVITPFAIAVIYYAMYREFPDSEPKAVTVDWHTPAPIMARSALSTVELDATATSEGKEVEGEFVYNPALGTTLTAGTQTLSVKFTPKDSSEYLTEEKTVTVVVNPSESSAPKPATVIDRSQSAVRIDNNGGQITGLSIDHSTVTGEHDDHAPRSLVHVEASPGHADHDIKISGTHLCNIHSWDDFLDCVAADPAGVDHYVDYQRGIIARHEEDFGPELYSRCTVQFNSAVDQLIAHQDNESKTIAALRTQKPDCIRAR